MADATKLPGFVDPFAEKAEHYPNAFVYGHSGVGKTGLAATAPAPLIIDLEKGAPVTVRAVGNTEARVVDVSSMKEIREVYGFLKSGEHDFRSVVIDPLWELQRLMMEEVMDKYPAKRAFNRVATMQDWQLVTEDFRKMFDAFRSLPMHTIMIAHAQNRQNEEDVVEPLLQGKSMLSYAIRSMDLLGYMRTEYREKEDKTVRALVVEATETIAAKNRGGVLPPVVYNPNLTDIFGKMMSSSQGGSK